MTRRTPKVEIRKLSAAQRRELARRERRHQRALERQGYTTQMVVDDSGCFGVVVVEDPEAGRTGLLLPDGRVQWTDQAMGPGALADATVRDATIDGTPL